ncbi:MAG TPA: CbtA family protein [Acidimicrobiia bacterium]|nr:CbtA family protein [Acidimicrobiia bacterium]HZQ76488.1 CbtA family protein [Acidimicrobiia bacterium]
MWKRFDPSRPLAVIVGAVVAGVVAGLLASVLLTFTAEPVIDRAIALEGAHQAQEPNAAVEPEIVARSTQKGVGRFAAYGLGGGAYGVLFGIAFLALRRRTGVFDRALLAGGLLAGAFTVMPFLKYPPNPPGVGDPATLSERQWKYLALIFLSLVILAGAARLSGRLRQRRWADDERRIAVGLAVVVPLGVICAALPPFHDAVDVPANLLWRFRMASLGGNLLLWAVLTAGFGAAAVRRERELAAPVPEGAAGGAFRPATSA